MSVSEDRAEQAIVHTTFKEARVWCGVRDVGYALHYHRVTNLLKQRKLSVTVDITDAFTAGAAPAVYGYFYNTSVERMHLSTAPT